MAIAFPLISMSEKAISLQEGYVMKDCKGCEFSNKAINTLECRKNPPVFLTLTGTDYGFDDNYFRGFWPQVSRNGWCGEWREK